MKILAVVLFVFLAGCAASPEKLNAVATEESARMPKPSKPFSAFLRYELKPISLSADVLADEDKIKQANILDEKIREKLDPLFANWASAGGANRFWIGAFAGSSSVDIDFKVTDSQTNEVIAKPRIQQNAGAMTGAWSIGKSDQNLHDYIAHITHQYFSRNY